MTGAVGSAEHEDAPPTVHAQRDGDRLMVALGGRIVLAHIEAIIARLGAVDARGAAGLVVDLADVEALDTAGAWVIYRFMRPFKREGASFELRNASEAQQALLARMEPAAERRTLRRVMVSPIHALIERVGEGTIEGLREARRLISFFGLTTVSLTQAMLQPSRLRVIAFLSHIEQTGLDAMPIVGLLSFLIGVVHGLSGRRPAAPLRRRDLHRQPARHLGPARARRPADRDHHRRPLGQRLHRPDRHDEGQPGGRRAAHARPRPDRGAGPAARARR